MRSIKRTNWLKRRNLPGKYGSELHVSHSFQGLVSVLALVRLSACPPGGGVGCPLPFVLSLFPPNIICRHIPGSKEDNGEFKNGIRER